MTEIGTEAFYYCSSLKEVYCKPATPPTANKGGNYGWYAFYDNASGRKIYVPVGSGYAYVSADGWSEYASMIAQKAM